MRYFKILFLFFMLPVFGQEIETNKEALEKGQSRTDAFKQSDIVKETLRGSDKNNPTLEQASQDMIYDRKSAVRRGASLLESNTEDTNPLWKQLSSAAQDIPEMINKKNTRYGDQVDAFIMVSLSMPKTSLETLVAEIQYEYPLKNIVLAFQGYNPNNPRKTFAEIAEFTPREIVRNLSIVVDPTVFNKLEVTQVPFFAIKTKDNSWKKVLGDITFREAIQETESHYEEFVAVGKTYPIIEPNLLALIHEKIRETDWNAQINEATERAIRRKNSLDISVATTSYTYLVDGTTTIEKDVMHDGEIIVPAGTSVNPLDEMILTNKYAIVDLTSESQLNILRYWKLLHERIKVIAVEFSDKQSMQMLQEEFGEIHQLDPMLKQRFGLEYIPSLVGQQGNQLKVEVIQHDKDLTKHLAGRLK